MRPDLESAVAAMASPHGIKKCLKRLDTYLDESEQVSRLARGYLGSDHASRGLVALTDWRVLLIRPVFMGAATEDVALSRISSVRWEAGLTRGNLAVLADGHWFEVTELDSEDGKVLADGIRASISRTGEK